MLHVARAIVLSDCLTSAYYVTTTGELGATADRFSGQNGLDILVRYIGWPVEHVNFVEGKSWEQMYVIVLY
jgi:hypothetical protein